MLSSNLVEEAACPSGTGSEYELINAKRVPSYYIRFESRLLKISKTVDHLAHESRSIQVATSHPFSKCQDPRRSRVEACPPDHWYVNEQGWIFKSSLADFNHLLISCVGRVSRTGLPLAVFGAVKNRIANFLSFEGVAESWTD